MHILLAGSWAVVALLSAARRGSGSALWTSSELAASGLLLLTLFEVRAHHRTWIILPLAVCLAAGVLSLLTALSSTPTPQYPMHGRGIRLPVILGLYGVAWWMIRRQRTAS